MKKFFMGALFLGLIAITGIAVANAATTPFNTNLSFEMTGSASIKALQQFLKDQGVYAGPITGNYLTLTMEGVKAFQIMNKITPSSGYFGPLTRAVANAIALSASPTPVAANPTTTTASAGVVAGASSTNLLAYLQFQLDSMFQTVRGLQQKFFGHGTTSNPTSIQTTITSAPASAPIIAPSAPATPVSTPVTTQVAVGTGTGTSTGSGSNNSGNSNSKPATTPTVTTTPIPATTTLTLNINVNGGSAKVNNFTITVKDNSVSSIIFSGIFSGTTNSTSQKFTLTQGHSYAVTEATTANSTNYSISLNSSCAGIVATSPITCAITNTYNAPASTGTGTGSSGSTGSTQNQSGSSGTTSGTSPSAPAQSSSGLVWGAYTGDSPSTLSSFTNLVGQSPEIQAIFLSLGLDSFPTNYTQTVGQAGKTLLIFWEPDNGSDDINQPNFNYSAILSGTYDANMTQFAAAAKAYGYPVILVPMDEMNGNWEPWGGTVNGNTPAQFTQAWIHIHNLFAGVSNVKFGWDPNNESVPDTSANAISAYWPGSQYVDYVGVDGFNGNGDPWQSFSQVFPSSLMTQLASYGKPVYIFSMGSTENSTDPTAKATWITQGIGPGGAISTFPDIAGWVWFNENGGDSSSNWLVNSDPAALVAFEASIQ